MADIVTPDQRSRMMAGITGKNTKPEIYIRRLLHGAGYRFRLHRRDLPGRPDIVLPKYKTAIFVEGCFWHGHENCHLFRLPKTRTDFWRQKIEANIERDKKNRDSLLLRNWRILQIWECSLKGKKRLDDDLILQKVSAFLANPSSNFFEIRDSSCN